MPQPHTTTHKGQALGHLFDALGELTPDEIRAGCASVTLAAFAPDEIVQAEHFDNAVPLIRWAESVSRSMESEPSLVNMKRNELPPDEQGELLAIASKRRHEIEGARLRAARLPSNVLIGLTVTTTILAMSLAGLALYMVGVIRSQGVEIDEIKREVGSQGGVLLRQAERIEQLEKTQGNH